MTFDTMRNDLGSLINQVDSSGVFSSTIITTTEADRWLNQAYEEVYMWYALANRVAFQQEATLDLSDGVSDYTFGGDATDVLAVLWLGLKYSATDTYYRRAVPRSYPDTLLIGNETFDTGAPVYYRVTKKVSGTPINGIKIDPAPTDDVTTGLKIMYLERPAVLTGSNTPTRIPSELHKWIVLGASVNCFTKLEQDSRAERMQNRFDKKMAEFMATHQVTSSDGTHVIKPFRRRGFNVYTSEE